MTPENKMTRREARKHMREVATSSVGGTPNNIATLSLFALLDIADALDDIAVSNAAGARAVDYISDHLNEVGEGT